VWLEEEAQGERKVQREPADEGVIGSNQPGVLLRSRPDAKAWVGCCQAHQRTVVWNGSRSLVRLLARIIWTRGPVASSPRMLHGLAGVEFQWRMASVATHALLHSLDCSATTNTNSQTDRLRTDFEMTSLACCVLLSGLSLCAVGKRLRAICCSVYSKQWNPPDNGAMGCGFMETQTRKVGGRGFLTARILNFIRQVLSWKQPGMFHGIGPTSQLGDDGPARPDASRTSLWVPQFRRAQFHRNLAGEIARFLGCRHCPCSPFTSSGQSRSRALKNSFISCRQRQCRGIFGRLDSRCQLQVRQPATHFHWRRSRPHYLYVHIPCITGPSSRQSPSESLRACTVRIG